MTSLLLSLMLLLTGCSDNSSAKQKIGDRHLEDPEHHIKDSPDILKHDSTILYTGWYYVVDTPNSYKRQLDKSDETYYLDPKPIVTAKNVFAFVGVQRKQHAAVVSCVWICALARDQQHSE